MVHVSQLSSDRVENPSEVVNQGQRVWVKVIEIKDDEATGKQKISLSMRNVNQSNGVDLDPGNMDLSGGGGRGGDIPGVAGGVHDKAVHKDALNLVFAKGANTNCVYSGKQCVE